LLNTAAAMALPGAKITAIELDSFSSFAMHLRKSPPSNFGQILELDPKQINDSVVNDCLITLPFGVRALFAPSMTKNFRDLSPDHAAATVRICASQSDFTLVDLPARLSRAHEAVVRASSFVSLVLEPDPISVEVAKLTAQIIAGWGLDDSMLGMVVVNRMPNINAVRLPEIRSRVGYEIVGIVPPAAEACVVAIEAAKPLLLLQPEAKFTMAVNDVAYKLSQNPVEKLRL
jgi:MinD-like ATPase involved in chromosome partitioning or flagellar assembly